MGRRWCRRELRRAAWRGWSDRRTEGRLGHSRTCRSHLSLSHDVTVGTHWRLGRDRQWSLWCNTRRCWRNVRVRGWRDISRLDASRLGHGRRRCSDGRRHRRRWPAPGRERWDAGWCGASRRAGRRCDSRARRPDHRTVFENGRIQPGTAARRRSRGCRASR